MSVNLKILNPDFESDIQEKLKRQFFMHLMGFGLTSIKPGCVSGSVDISEKLMQQNYFVHGGVMATAADIVMGFAAYTLIPKGFGVVTVDLNISFLNPGIGDVLIAEGRVVKTGKSIVFCEADIWVQNGTKKVQTNRATATMHQIVL